jgi:LysM repeat protein
MKILKIFGVVVGIHLFALILIFANPGCSSTSKPTPAPVDTLSKTEPAPTVTVPYNSPMTVSTGFNPDAPATASSSSSGTPLYRPTRPGSTAATAVTNTPVQDVTPATTYTVKANDTFWDLGKKFKIPYQEIAAANNMKSTAPLHAGQKLIIPGKSMAATTAPAVAASKAGANGKAPTTAPAATSPSPSASAANGNSMKHMVKPGESLSSIAHQYGVTVKELGTVNNISDPAKVKAGVELIIPGWTGSNGGKTASKSGKAPAAATTPEPKPTFNLLDTPPTAPATKSGEPPVIKVDDSPLSPAPKSN